MAKKKLQLSEVVKKDLKVVSYLLSFGLGSWLAQKYVTANEVMALVFGGAVNYILFRIEKELTNNGYREALK